MRVEGSKIVLERKDCHCGDGTVATKKWKVCPKCKGTGRRGSGKCRNCNSYGNKPGYVSWYDQDDRSVCQACGGNFKDFASETWTDYVPQYVLDSLPLKVVRSQRQMTWTEQHLGAGIHSLVDYGRHKNQTDEEIIEYERKHLRSVQLCKIVVSKDDLTLAKELLIVTGDQGYSVLPNYDRH